MTIDWEKPLRIKGHDGQEHEVRVRDTGVRLLQGDGTVNRILTCNIDGWKFKWVASHKGEDRLGIMPRVYNAKRKPKEGEWWMCRTVGDAERPLIKSESVWVSSIGNWYKVVNVEPLYPLIKDPDF